ncbi:MAG: GGDEF domain-containing protein [Lachnotalea sp.]
MYENNKKMFGILICSSIGIIILLASLFFSKVDQTPLTGNDLIDFGDGWQINVTDQIDKEVQLPSRIKNVSFGDTMVLTKILPSDIDSKTCIFFRASHQNVRVYVDKVLVYSFGWNENRLFSKSPACVWVEVPMTSNQSGTQIKIELLGVYEKYANRINGIYIGDHGSIIHKIVNNNLGSILICVVLVVIGVCIICISVIIRNNKITTSFLRLGILSVLIGIWSACVTNTLQILFNNVYFLLNMEFLLFNLLLPIFLWFLLSFPYYSEQKWMNILFWTTIIQFLMIEGLQVIGIADYMESIKVTHITILGGIGYIIITGIRDLIQKHAMREEKILVASIVLLLIFIGIDLIRFYQFTDKDEGFYSRIGMLVFIGLWAIEVIRNMSKRFVSLARTKALETLAYEDLMTGLKNRTAFEERMNAYQKDSNMEELYIIIFDMNGLKHINDNYGHMKGDQAIIELSYIIKNTFITKGITYRIGGDEICVIGSESDLLDNEKLPMMLHEIEIAVEMSSKNLKVEYSVACGYAKVAGQDDKDIYQAFKEADHNMYESKQRMKQRER